MTRLTLNRLRAMQDAIEAMLAGEEGEGDAADVSFTDLAAASDWVAEQIARREERDND